MPKMETNGLEVFLCKRCHMAFLKTLWSSHGGHCPDCNGRSRTRVTQKNINILRFASDVQRAVTLRILHHHYIPLHGGIYIEAGDTVEYYLDAPAVVRFCRERDEAPRNAIRHQMAAGTIMDGNL